VLAVLFSLLLTLYLIIPEAIFRTIFGWYVPPRNFVISKAETAYRALVVAVLPLLFAWVFTWYMPIVQCFPFPVQNNTSELRRADYKLVASALYSEEEFKSSKQQFWPALTRSTRRQARLIAWYILLIGLEAWLAGWLAANYAKFKTNWLYSWLADKFLFSYISEWHPLLTPYMFIEKETTVQADILSTNGTLYQGTVTQHFIRDGSLTGVFLTAPRRFNRDLYSKDRDARAAAGQPKPNKEEYWQGIPSQNLYFFADKIFNMNLTYKPPEGQVADADAVKKLVIQISGSSLDFKNITITQETVSPTPSPEQSIPEGTG
jgi:hypothetical protein